MAEQSGADLAPSKVYARLVALGQEWADRNAAAQLYEDTTKSTLARLTLSRMEMGGCSKAQAELEALASRDFTAHVAQAVEARQASNRARVEYDCAKIWAELLRSANANKRTEMQLTGMG